MCGTVMRSKQYQQRGAVKCSGCGYIMYVNSKYGYLLKYHMDIELFLAKKYNVLSTYGFYR